MSASRPARRAFVTGATGFLGSHLVLALHEDGWDVTALHRPSSDLSLLRRLEGVRLVEGDITDRISVLEAMPDDLDAVFHAAASISFYRRNNPWQTRVNVDGTGHVVDAALQRGARCLVHTSSIAAYGIHPRTIDESAPRLGARSWIHYVRTKAQAEEAVRSGIERGLRAVILNPSNILGRYDRSGWSRIVEAVAKRKLPMVPPGRGSWCHAPEVARAHVSAVDRGLTGANYLLGGADASYLDVVRAVGERLAVPVPRRATPCWVMKTFARVLSVSSWWTHRPPPITPEAATLTCADMTCRSDRAIRELGYRTVALERMLDDAIGWLRETGRLASP